MSATEEMIVRSSTILKRRQSRKAHLQEKVEERAKKKGTEVPAPKAAKEVAEERVVHLQRREELLRQDKKINRCADTLPSVNAIEMMDLATSTIPRFALFTIREAASMEMIAKTFTFAYKLLMNRAKLCRSKLLLQKSC